MPRCVDDGGSAQKPLLRSTRDHFQDGVLRRAAAWTGMLHIANKSPTMQAYKYAMPPFSATLAAQTCRERPTGHARMREFMNFQYDAAA